MQLIFIGHTIKFSGDKALRLIFHKKIAFIYIHLKRNKLCFINEQTRLSMQIACHENKMVCRAI